MTTDYEARARALAGVRFRPQGRSRDGIDCLGLMLQTYAIPEDAVRRDYRLRGDHLSEVERGLSAAFRKISRRDLRPGDALLLQVQLDQLHFAVFTHRGFVHADARIGRVVETPGWPRWPLIGMYRKRVRAR